MSKWKHPPTQFAPLLVAMSNIIIQKLTPLLSQETTLCLTLEKTMILLEQLTVSLSLKNNWSTSSSWELLNLEPSIIMPLRTPYTIMIQSLIKMLSQLKKISRALKNFLEKNSTSKLMPHLIQFAHQLVASNIITQKQTPPWSQETTLCQILEKIMT